jgi:hypothetical protein|tara:strand:+ start:1730 stop:2059 length:330 start_codon:yes stop_codon:yes gene_type:complete
LVLGVVYFWYADVEETTEQASSPRVDSEVDDSVLAREVQEAHLREQNRFDALSDAEKYQQRLTSLSKLVESETLELADQVALAGHKLSRTRYWFTPYRNISVCWMKFQT